MNVFMQTILMYLGLVLCVVLAADALEYEVTGDCRDCRLLQHLERVTAME